MYTPAKKKETYESGVNVTPKDIRLLTMIQEEEEELNYYSNNNSGTEDSEEDEYDNKFKAVHLQNEEVKQIFG